jgi:hypothetical protein
MDKLLKIIFTLRLLSEISYIGILFTESCGYDQTWGRNKNFDEKVILKI